MYKINSEFHFAWLPPGRGGGGVPYTANAITSVQAHVSDSQTPDENLFDFPLPKAFPMFSTPYCNLD